MSKIKGKLHNGEILHDYIYDTDTFIVIKVDKINNSVKSKHGLEGIYSGWGVVLK